MGDYFQYFIQTPNMSVRVAVRVRPFNDREKGDPKNKLCVSMEGAKTILTSEEGKTRDYTFDYSFWSHDGFELDENGYSVPTDDRYYDQNKVYNCVGAEVLDNAWEGYNCCLFAYGQTGSGKSYSMIGYGANRGIVPMVAERIFDRIRENQEEARTFEVSVHDRNL